MDTQVAAQAQTEESPPAVARAAAPGAETTAGAPEVTVLIAARDRLDLLQEAVASCLDQEAAGYEVLVVDDGSGPETRHWLDMEAGRHPRLRVIHQAHQGIAAARRRGVRAARGAWICILDSDDRLLSGSLASIMESVRNSPGVDLIYTNNLHRMPGGSLRACLYPHFRTNQDMIRGILIRPRVPFKHSGTTFRREVALAVGDYDTALPIKVDVEFFLRFLAAGRRLQLFERPVIEYRMHRNSVSGRRILGIKIWCQLIDRYGPRSWFMRLGYKLARASTELLKLGYRAYRM